MPNYKTKSYSLDELEPLTQKTQNALKAELIKESGICPLCGEPLVKPVLDHQHLTSKETIGKNGAGLVRGVLCSGCNSLLGKIENNSKRFAIQNLPKYLKNAVKYLEADNLPYIHSSETRRLKEPLKKSVYNRFIKIYCEKYNKTKTYAQRKFKYAKYYNKSLNELRNLVS